MSKIKLPKKVAEAIEKMRNEGWEDGFLVNFHEFIDIEYKPTRPLDSYIYNVSKYLSESGDNRLNYIKAIINGYEVDIDKNLEVGEWVVHNNTEVLKIDEMNHVNLFDFEIKYSGCQWAAPFPISKCRLATKVEIENELDRRKWSKINRKVGEIKKGDIVFDGKEYHEVQRVNCIDELLYEVIIQNTPYQQNELLLVATVESKVNI